MKIVKGTKIISKWDTGKDGNTRKGKVTEFYNGGGTICIRWNDGHKEWVDRGDIRVIRVK